MKHFFLKSTLALLLFVLGVGQASANQGPWSLHSWAKGWWTSEDRMVSFNTQDDSSWGGNWSSYDDGNGMGAFNYAGFANKRPHMTFHMIAQHYVAVPSYTRIVRSWKYDICSNLHSYYCTSHVRFFDDLASAKSSTFPVKQGAGKTSNDHGYYYNTNQDSKWHYSSDIAATFTYDNRSGSSSKNIYKYVVFFNSCTNYQKANGIVNHYASFRHRSGPSDSYFYYKYVTFNANGGTGSMSQQTVENSANLTANKFTREGFTFAGWNTKADGTGTQYAAGANITATSSSKGPVTLYAQWTAQPITAKFDYTYRTSDVAGVAETYVHMDNNNESAAITNKVRVNLRNASGTVLVSKVLTAPAATTPAGTPNSSSSTHKTAAITLNVVQSGTENFSGANCTVVLGSNYVNYRSIDFEVLTNASTQNSQTVAAHWVSTKQNATNYIFKYEGHESKNMFNLTWRVNLTNLSMYPTDIFVKPMRKGTHTGNGGSTELVQIPAMEGIDGIECEFAGYIDGDQAKGAYYTGEYKVLKTCAHGNNYNYQIGLTGFILDGITYYLAENEGDIPSDMISSAVATPTSANITFDRAKEQIPVLILSPNVANNETLADSLKATVSGRANYKLYVDSSATRTVNLAQFEAVRPGYTFTGWKDTYDQTAYAADGDYHFNMGTKATTTLLAQWERTNAPVIDMTEMKEEGQNFVYTVNISDELNDLRDVKYIYASGNNAPAVDAQDWIALTLTEGVGRIELPMLNDKFGKNLWVKASNEHKTTVLNLGTVRSIYTVQANANPDSHVIEQIENGHMEEKNIEGKDTTVFIVDGTSDVHLYDYYSTFFFRDRTFLVSNATAYTAQRAGTNLDLTEIEPDAEGKVIVPAGVAVILRKNYATDGKIECEEVTDIYSDNTNNDLKGTDLEETISDLNKYYILSYAQNGLGFYHPATTTLAAHKAYIKLESAAAAPRAFIFNFGNGNNPVATAIENTEAETLLNGPVYNIYGQMVAPSLDKAENLANGIYVVNGKKVVINK